MSNTAPKPDLLRLCNINETDDCGIHLMSQQGCANSKYPAAWQRDNFGSSPSSCATVSSAGSLTRNLDRLLVGRDSDDYLILPEAGYISPHIFQLFVSYVLLGKENSKITCSI
jgi:hypothetical protein